MGSVAACATTDRELAGARDSWRAATYDQVVAAWGAPGRSEKNAHTWLSEDRAPPVQGSGGGAGGAIFSAASGDPKRCERTLVFRDGRVLDQSWTGDPGFCKRFARRP